MKKPETSYRRRRKLGALLYFSAVQYFLVQFVTGLRFSPRYSLANNTISDLGNSSCAVFNGRSTCSPLHTFMNVSFLTLGMAMIAGSVLLHNQYKKSRNATAGFGLFAVGGFGTVFVGLFPENTVLALHSMGATLPFLFGNVGVVILGASLKLPKAMAVYSVFSGMVALTALAIYVSGHYVGLGKGGVERLVAYPQTIWMVVMSAYFFVTSSRPTSD